MITSVLLTLFMAAVFVFPAYLIHSYINYWKLQNKTNTEKFMAKCVTVNATLIKKGRRSFFDVPGMTTSGPHRRCAYQYFYKGKKYMYRGWFHDNPPKRLTLYILKNPRKATLSLSDQTGIPWFTIYLIVFGILLFFMA